MGLIDLLFPKRCIGCGNFGSYLCSKCTKNILQKDLFCPYCGKVSDQGSTHLLCYRQHCLDGLWSLGAYKGILAKAIKQLKYRFVSDLGQALTDLMIWYWTWKKVKFWDQDWVIVPVPLHPRRERWRGFNQSALLAQLLSKKLGLRYLEALKRIRYTKPQTGFDRHERKRNIKNAFAVSPNFEVTGFNCLLIDDVWTTGSTLKECAYILKKNGATQIWAITLSC